MPFINESLVLVILIISPPLFYVVFYKFKRFNLNKLQTKGKGLGPGYPPIAAIMFSQKVVNVLMKGSGQIIQGQTYQAMPIQAIAA
jgi:hypothetical protein